MISKHALPGPRVVEIQQRKLKKTTGEWEIEHDTVWPPRPEGMRIWWPNSAKAAVNRVVMMTILLATAGMTIARCREIV
jgi:hypothetical protein